MKTENSPQQTIKKPARVGPEVSEVLNLLKALDRRTGGLVPNLTV